MPDVQGPRKSIANYSGFGVTTPDLIEIAHEAVGRGVRSSFGSLRFRVLRLEF